MYWDYNELSLEQQNFLKIRFEQEKNDVYESFKTYGYKFYDSKTSSHNPLARFLDNFLSRKYAGDVAKYYFNQEIEKYLDPSKIKEEQGLNAHLPDKDNPKNKATLNYILFYTLTFTALFIALGVLSSHFLSEILMAADVIEQPAVLFGIIGNQAAHQGIIPGLIAGAALGAYLGYNNGMAGRKSLKEAAGYGYKAAKDFVVTIMQEYKTTEQENELIKQKVTDKFHQAQIDEIRRRTDAKDIIDNEQSKELERQRHFDKTTTEQFAQRFHHIESRLNRLERPERPMSHQERVTTSRMMADRTIPTLA